MKMGRVAETAMKVSGSSMAADFDC